jgi:hypothetical protein
MSLPALNFVADVRAFLPLCGVPRRSGHRARPPSTLRWPTTANAQLFISPYADSSARNADRNADRLAVERCMTFITPGDRPLSRWLATG